MNVIKHVGDHIESPLHTLLSHPQEIGKQAEFRFAEAVDNNLSLLGRTVVQGAKRIFQMPGLKQKNPPIAESLGNTAHPEAEARMAPFAEYHDSHNSPKMIENTQVIPPPVVVMPHNVSVQTGDSSTKEMAKDVARGTITAGLGMASANLTTGYAGILTAAHIMGGNSFLPGILGMPIGVIAGVPLATGALGGMLWKNHRVVGTLTGAGAGILGVATASAYSAGAAAAGTALIPSVLGGTTAALSALGTAASGALVPAAVGGGLYALGRWQGSLRNKPKAGIFKTMFVRAPMGLATIPYDLLKKKR